MNSLLIFPEELIGETRAVVSGERASGVLERHRLEVGIRLPIGIYGKKLGHGVIESLASEKVSLSIELDEEPPPRLPVHLIVAVPRPQTVKKVISTAATFGIQSVHFVRTDNVERSYLQSKSLLEPNVRYQITLGLEQAYDCIGPEVTVHERLSKVFQETIPGLCTDTKRGGDTVCCVLAHTSTARRSTLSRIARATNATRFIIALGPESGWSEVEVERFIENNFEPVSLGDRMLRVETAFAAIMGEVNALKC